MIDELDIVEEDSEDNEDIEDSIGNWTDQPLFCVDSYRR